MEKKTKEKIVLFGTGTLPRAAYRFFTHDSPHEIVGFTVDRDYLKEKSLFNLPVVPFDEVESFFPPEDFKMFLALNFQRVNKFRAEKYFSAKKKGYEFIGHISSRAIVYPGTSIGENCLISDNTICQPHVKIGDNVLIWSGNLIGHDVEIKDHCFISSHVVIGGQTVIEPYCFLGINSTIRDCITIARECVIGAAALILKDTEERGVYLGPNATKISKKSDELKII